MIWGIVPILAILSTIFFDEETSLWITLWILVIMGMIMALTKEDEN